VFLSDGTKNIDSNGDGADESVYTDYGNAILDRSFSVSTDTFLSNQRSARSV
jgi:ribose 5-phosphate isomerase